MFFYLKINRREKYTFRNLQHWIDIVEGIEGSDYCILCDNTILQKEVLEQVRFTKEPVAFLESEKQSADLNEIVPNITNADWRNAGYAHLTTFLDAEKKEYPCFWNIDADDTHICLESGRARELLCEAEAYARGNQIDMMSLDMWTTRTYGNHWSFGITYSNNRADWMSVMKRYCRDEELKARQIRNVDGYFSCLKTCTSLKIETFYFENLRFIHYSNDFFKRPDVSGFFIWKEGELNLPILSCCFGLEQLGRLPIAKQVIKLDIGITDEESTEALLAYALPFERQLLEGRLAALKGV